MVKPIAANATENKDLTCPIPETESGALVDDGANVSDLSGTFIYVPFMALPQTSAAVCSPSWIPITII